MLGITFSTNSLIRYTKRVIKIMQNIKKCLQYNNKKGKIIYIFYILAKDKLTLNSRITLIDTYTGVYKYANALIS